jgi:hypothetical protein
MLNHSASSAAAIMNRPAMRFAGYQMPGDESVVGVLVGRNFAEHHGQDEQHHDRRQQISDYIEGHFPKFINRTGAT